MPVPHRRFGVSEEVAFSESEGVVPAGAVFAADGRPVGASQGGDQRQRMVVASIWSTKRRRVNERRWKATVFGAGMLLDMHSSSKRTERGVNIRLF
jgi:hypothetical protein